MPFLTPAHPLFQAEEYDFSVDCRHEDDMISNASSEIPSVCMDFRTLSKRPISGSCSEPEDELGLLDLSIFGESVGGVWEDLLCFPEGLDTTIDPAKLVLLSPLPELSLDGFSSGTFLGG